MPVNTIAQDGDTPTIPFERYISREYVQLEKRRLWPQVWQVACREEEIPKAGNYVTYDIGDSSIIIVRTQEGKIAAHHNMCRHRGRRLVSGRGKTGLFHCNFHGWNYDLNGQNVYVQDPDDWGPAMECMALNLKPVRVATWAGFVWVDLRPDGETLVEYLETVPNAIDAYEFDKLRYRWYTTLHLQCNWKVAIEAFTEGYHVAATHTQILKFVGDDYTTSGAYGRHSNMSYGHRQSSMNVRSRRLTEEPVPEDPRSIGIYFFEYMEENLKAQFTDRNYRASRELMDKISEDADAGTVFVKVIELSKKMAEEEGAGWPERATFEHFAETGAGWHVFPNIVMLPWFDGALCYRSRPNADDPDRCIFDIWSLVRYAPGQEPPLDHKVFKDPVGDEAGAILSQDISNMAEVQRGMKTGAFTVGIPNPVQEMAIINFHANLARYVEQGQSRT